MLEAKPVRYSLFLLALLSFVSVSAWGGNILFVTGEPAVPDSGDDAIKSFFEKLGHRVTYIDDDEGKVETQEAASKADLVYISESVDSKKINNEITTIETAMIVAEPHCFDEMGMSVGEARNQKLACVVISIVEPNHPLAGGYCGDVDVLVKNDGGEFVPGPSTAGGDAVVIAKGSGDKQKGADVYFVYGKGAALAKAPADGSPQVAAGIRIGFFAASPKTQAMLSEKGYDLLAAAVKYALGVKVKKVAFQKVSVVMSVSDKAKDKSECKAKEEVEKEKEEEVEESDSQPIFVIKSSARTEDKIKDKMDTEQETEVEGQAAAETEDSTSEPVFVITSSVKVVDETEDEAEDEGEAVESEAEAEVMVEEAESEPEVEITAEVEEEEEEMAVLTTKEDTPVFVTLVGTDADGDVLTYKVVTDPSHGRLDGTAPKLLYTPEPDFNGSDSFTFNVSDGTSDGEPVTVLISVVSVNDPPTAKDASLTTQEDTLVSMTLVGSDTEGDKLSYSIVEGPSKGTLSGTIPNLTYKPNIDFSGRDSFTFKVNDGQADSEAGTVSITLTPVNDPPKGSFVGASIHENPPVAEDISVTTGEDEPVQITLRGSGLVEELLKYTLVTRPNPLRGSLEGVEPNLTYKPRENFNGEDSFTFKVGYDSVESNVATVSVTVKAINDPPNANDDSARTKEDESVAINVLKNDIDVDGDLLRTITAFTQGRNGSVAVNADNTLNYTPEANFYGSDSFTYTVSDGEGGTDTARVNVIVEPVDDRPVAVDDSVATKEDESIRITLKGSDPDGDSLSFGVVEGPFRGKLSGRAPRLRYVPSADLNGPDSFTFKVGDGKRESTAKVSIMVDAVNDKPVAHSAGVTTEEDTPVSITLEGSDVDGDSLSFSMVEGPFHGELTGKAPNLSYKPNKDYNGRDKFIFKVNDDTEDSDNATISIVIKAVNDAPKANDDNATTYEDCAGVMIDVLANDTDVDGDSLKITNVTQGSNGRVTINPDNTVSYVPNKEFCGSDDFTYTISDGVEKKTADATVRIKVEPRNDKPRFTSTDVTTATAGVEYVYDVNATDPDTGDILTYSLTAMPEGMTIGVVSGLIQWIPDTNQVGSHRVVVKVTDNGTELACETRSFTIVVSPAEEPEKPAEAEPIIVVPSSGQKDKKVFLMAVGNEAVRVSDDNRAWTDSGLSAFYDFSNISAPADSQIASVVLYIEHFEDERFTDGQLQWSAGAGWPGKPVVWVSMDAPVHKEEWREATDSWDITSFVDTVGKVNALQFQVKNNSDTTGRKSFVDYIYAVINLR